MAKRKPMSEAARLAASQRMKAMHAAKKAQTNTPTQISQPATPNQPTVVQAVDNLDKPLEQPLVSTDEGAVKPTLNPGINKAPTETISQPDYGDLQRQVLELKAMLLENQIAGYKAAANQQPQAQGPQFGHRGNLVGTVDKYSTLTKYPDPRERLSNEEVLKRFAFKENYELEYKQEVVSYETIDGVRMKEPKFTLELNRVVYDEDTGERTNGRYTICRQIMHEDPDAAIVVAQENGLEVDEENQAQFLNDMRYIRMRDWLVEAFMPPKPSQPKKNKKEMVIGGKLVEYFEINSEDSETIPFSQLKSKV